MGAEPVRVQIGLHPEENGEISYEISSAAATDKPAIVYNQGTAILTRVAEIASLDLNAWQAECCESSLSAPDIYYALKAAGIDYGPSYQGIEKLYVGRERVLAKLTLPASVSATKDQFVLHPSIMDSALQASSGMMDQRQYRWDGYPQTIPAVCVARN